MCSLSTFPPPAPVGYITACELNADLLAVAKGAYDSNQYLQGAQYPQPDVSHDLHRPAMSKESARSAFLEHEDTPRKRLLRAWYESGLTGILGELASGEKGAWTSVACAVLAVVRWTHNLHGSLFPHLALSSEDLVAEFSTNLNWKEGFIRCFAWHPHTTKFAIALRDDSVKIYFSRKDNIVPLLKHKLQKGAAQLAWKPLSASLLAVACHTCILIWNVDPTSLATRPSTSSVRVLSQSGHGPVTSLAWCPDGGLLLSGSPADTAIMVWDVAMESCVPLRRVGGGGVSMLRWSPDGSKVLAACPSSIFRVWETKQWTCEKWSKLSGRCQAACWSPDGSILLFATADQPTIYCLTFHKHLEEHRAGIGGSKVAVTCVDLTATEIEQDGDSVSVGGVVQNMVWDPTGERLAIQFKGVSPELIALFQTRLEPTIELIPCGFIRGSAGEVPHILQFQPQYEQGALLTVVWSGGRISHIPLFFVSRSAVDTSQLYQARGMNGNVQRSIFTDTDPPL